MQDSAADPLQAEAAFGQRVRAHRQQRKWTQRRLADLIGVDASAVSRIEQGVRAVRLGEAASIAKALDVDLDRLVFGGAVPPEEWLRKSREAANSSMHVARAAAVEMADAYLEIAEALSKHPSLFETFDDGNSKWVPKTVDEYFAWVLQRIERIYDNDPNNSARAFTTDGELAIKITALIEAMMNGVITDIPFPESEVDLTDEEEAAALGRGLQGLIPRDTDHPGGGDGADT
ncbi:helix-turn-helix domain-containing protein [Mycolicibacterium grossiae]|nr:helix-turn-helix transcriptional regulator [Mycolicibacterium grossiae]